jgi:undecaprenyl-diphosphatase
MTAMNGIGGRPETAIWMVARRCAGNVGRALARLFRPIGRYPDGFAWLPSYRHLALAVAIALAVFLFGMIVIDAAASRGAGSVPRWLIDFFDEITDFGKSGWFLWPLGLSFLGLAALPNNLTKTSQAVLATIMVRVGFLFVAIGAPGLFATIIKRMIGRARPGVGGSLDPYLFSPFQWTAAYAGLPSGHATTAFAVMAAVGTLWPRARTALLIYALLIALSRIVVTAHYPTDVAAGALVGIVGVLMVRRWFALQRLGFSIAADGSLRQFPGPSPRRIKAVARELLAE